MRWTRRILPLLVLGLALAPLVIQAEATGVTLLKTRVANVHQGLLVEGEVDAYPDPTAVGQLLGQCPLPVVGPGATVILVVEDVEPGDLVVLWTHEEVDGDVRRVATPALGDPPMAVAPTLEPSFGCPLFEVEGRSVHLYVAYTVVTCERQPLVGSPCDSLPLPR